MGDRGNSEVRGGRPTSPRMVVEAAIDVSNGANRIKWVSYRSKMSGKIAPWRKGGSIVEERASSEFSGETEGD
jgi:hypothetical protein